MNQIVKSLVNDELDVEEIAEYLNADAGWIRFHALLALSRWFGNHPNFVPSNTLITAVKQVCLRKDQGNLMIWSLVGINTQTAAIACLSDIKTSEGTQALSDVLATLQLSQAQSEMLDDFLQRRKGDTFLTGSTS